MSRNALRFATLILAALFVLGCASGPKPGTIPARESAEDCLILFPVEYENNTGTTNARKYAYDFSGDYGSIVLPNYSTFVSLVVHEPGVVLTKLRTFIPEGQGFVGPKGEYVKNFPLPYESGKIVVTPFMFTLRFESDKGGGYITYSDIVKASDTVIQETMARAATLENAGTWK